MLTTIGLWPRAMVRKVCASSAPAIGALFIGGAAIGWAIDAGAMSRREAMTMPMASDATAMRAA